MKEKKPLLISCWGLARHHLKAHALANLFFGFPLILIITVYLKVDWIDFLKVSLLYMSIYGLIFIPLYALLPFIVLGKRLDNLTQDFSSGEKISRKTANLVENLMDYPLMSSLFIGVSDVFGFSLGVIVFRMGVIKSMMQWVDLVSVVTIGTGIIVGLIDSFLNYVFSEQYLHQGLEFLGGDFLQENRPHLTFTRVSVFQKVFYLVLFATMGSQIALFLIFFTGISVFSPEWMWAFLLGAGIVGGLSFSYVFLVTNVFVRSLVEPLRSMHKWSQEVMRGNLRARVKTVSNDDLGEVIFYANQMVATLEHDHKVSELEKKKTDLVLKNISDGVVALNDTGQIVFVSRGAENICGWREEELLGQDYNNSLSFFDTEGHLLDLLEQISLSKEENRKKQEGELFELSGAGLMNKSGDLVHINLSVSQIAGGEVVGVSYLLTFYDVTSEKELERMKLDFVAMAAHELRTPITSIMGYLSVLFEELGEDLNEEHRRFFQRSITSGKRLNALMENLLSVTKIERGNLELEIHETNWVDLVKDRLEDLRPMAEEKGLSLILEIPKKEIPLLRIDGFRMMEVINNLVGNAINYTPKGEIRLSFEYLASENKLLTRIKDTGVGIPQQHMEHLFEKFYRVSGLLEEGSKGTGLGLFISKSIVEKHGGEIWVESKVSEGSTFTFSLPTGN